MTEQQFNQLINKLTELLNGIEEVKQIFAEMKQDSVRTDQREKQIKKELWW